MTEEKENMGLFVFLAVEQENQILMSTGYKI